MLIESVRIENFRCFKDQTILFDNYTCFVGANGAGKSTVFNALNVFFRQYKDSKTDLSKLTKDDFHHKNTEGEIRITVTFSNLTEAAQESLSDYCRQGKLIVTAVAKYSPETERAEVKQYGNRLGFDSFRPFFEAEKAGASVAELKSIYTKLRTENPDLPLPGTKSVMVENLQEYEASHPANCVLIPSEDQFYGATRGQNRLEKHIQWVFVPAVKDITEESEESKTSALGVILARTVRSKVNFSEKVSELLEATRREYQSVLDDNQKALNEISTSLQERLAAWAHPNITANLLWSENGDKSIRIEEPTASIQVGERGFEGNLSRFGHGIQRSYMFALLQELSMLQDESAPSLIMCIEEPELYQHPPQARYLAETLLELSLNGTQIFLCTHNPLFIPGDGFESVRIAKENGTPSFTSVSHITYEELAEKLKSIGEDPVKEQGLIAKLYPTISPVTSEMFFCKILIIVEGYEDVAYIKSYLHLSGRLKEYRKYGCHIVPVMGKSEIIKPLAVAQLLNIPTYVIWDADTNKSNGSEIVKHKKDNRALLNLLGWETLSEWPDVTCVKDNMTMWQSNLGDEIKKDFDPAIYEETKNKACQFYGNAGGLNKNPLAIIKQMELSWDKGSRSEQLLGLISDILAFAHNHTAGFSSSIEVHQAATAKKTEITTAHDEHTTTAAVL